MNEPDPVPRDSPDRADQRQLSSMTVRAPVPRRGRCRTRILALGVIAGLIVAAASGSLYGYVRYQLAQIRRVSVPDLTGAKRAATAPTTILIVGSDSRAGNAGSDANHFGSASQVQGQRSDTIVLVHLDPRARAATELSIPRDLWVPIPGKTYHQRINTTFDTGPDLLVRAVRDDLGIAVDHYVELNFQSFRQVVDAIGGVKVYFPTPARDAYSGLNITAPGCYGLTGDMALSFVRARHYQYYRRGRWVSEADSDLARIRRQQLFIKKAVAKALSTGFTDIGRLNGIVGGVVHNLTLDSSFTQAQLLGLARAYRNFLPDQLAVATLPTTSAVIAGNDVLVLKEPDAQTAVASFLAARTSPPITPTAAPAPAPSLDPTTIHADVLNGSGSAGQAAGATAALRRAGFSVGTPRTANSVGQARSTIRFAPGQRAKARYLQGLLAGPSDLSADPGVAGKGFDLVLVTGTSFRGVSAAGAGHPTTTAPTTPTTATPIPGDGDPANPPC